MSVASVSRRVSNLAHFLTRNARRFPDRSALIRGEDIWSWAELDRRVSGLAAALRRRGVGRGDRVLVHTRNGNAIVETMLATFRLGGIWVPTNVRLLPDDVAGLAMSAGTRAFLCDGAFPDHAAAVRAAVPGLSMLARIGAGRFGDVEHDTLVEEGAAHPVTDEVDASVEYDDPCWFFFTSGTTGRPKAAVLTHGQMAFIVNNHLCDLLPGTTEADASLVVAPLSHGAGVHLLTQVARGAVSVLPEGDRLDEAQCWALVEQYRVSNMFTVPTILTRLVEHPSRLRHDHTSLRHVIYAGAPMYREDQRRALRALGPVLVQYFGLGEVTGAITVLPPGLHDPADGPGERAGTCGVERTGVQIQIQDEAGREVPLGCTGEICCCGPAVFAGYWENPEANAKSFRDGWFRTGDLGRMDAEGFVYITGRQSDMYISGGSNVYPREIEEEILTHPQIAEVAVVGVPDPRWGEVGFAVVVRRVELPADAEGDSSDGRAEMSPHPASSPAGGVSQQLTPAGGTGPLDEAGLLAWLDGRVARYKQPRRVLFWDALPRSGYGKVTKALVRAELGARGLLSPSAEATSDGGSVVSGAGKEAGARVSPLGGLTGSRSEGEAGPGGMR